MGIADYRKYKKMKEFEAFLAEFGLTVEDLHKIAALKGRVEELEQRVSLLEKTPKPVEKEKSEEDKKAEAQSKGITRPEDFVQLFTTDLEELKSNA